MNPGSVSQWIEQAKDGNEDAIQRLWERYYQQLVHIARKNLLQLPRQIEGPEDIALYAFDSFCRDAQAGRFPQLQARDDLWRLLLAITSHKARDAIRKEMAAKRGGKRCFELEGEELSRILGREPDPGFAAQVAEECERLLNRLPDDYLRSIAIWKMEGWSNAEIARKLGRVERTVERGLQVIRSYWSEEQPT